MYSYRLDASSPSANVSDEQARSCPLSPANARTPGRIRDTGNPEIGTGTVLTGRQWHAIPGFAHGTLIATDRGGQPVERLAAGDRVLTLDHGYQQLLWSGRFTMHGSSPDAVPDVVMFRPDSIGQGRPSRPLRLVADHRILLSGPGVAMHLRESEAFASAAHMTQQQGVVRRSAMAGEFFHQLLFRDHQVILADGVWSESLFVKTGTIDMHPPALRRHLLNLAGGGHDQTARVCLHGWETDLVLRRPSVPAGSSAA